MGEISWVSDRVCNFGWQHGAADIEGTILHRIQLAEGYIKVQRQPV